MYSKLIITLFRVDYESCDKNIDVALEFNSTHQEQFDHNKSCCSPCADYLQLECTSSCDNYGYLQPCTKETIEAGSCSIELNAIFCEGNSHINPENAVRSGHGNFCSVDLASTVRIKKQMENSCGYFQPMDTMCKCEDTEIDSIKDQQLDTNYIELTSESNSFASGKVNVPSFTKYVHDDKHIIIDTFAYDKIEQHGGTEIYDEIAHTADTFIYDEIAQSANGIYDAEYQGIDELFFLPNLALYSSTNSKSVSETPSTVTAHFKSSRCRLV